MSQAELLVGDPAPELRVSAFLKGQPITAFANGVVYVVECWATWCGPCIDSIPHVSLLQATYPDVTVLAVAVREPDPEMVRAFVARRGDDMAYTVAVEAPIDDGGTSGWMFRNWCEAAFQPWIPSAFIVDREGRIAWIGHPTELDEPLAAIVSGTWDIAARALAHRDRIASGKIRERRAMDAAIERYKTANDSPSAVRVLNEAFALHPEFERDYGLSKFELLMNEDREAAQSYGRHLLDTVFANDSNLCMFLGRSTMEFVDIQTADACSSADRALAELGLAALRMAETLGDDGEVYHRPLTLSMNLAKALLALGNPSEALRYARSAQNWASTHAPEEAFPDLDDLIRRCEGAGATAADPRKTSPSVICEGDVCRLV